jgi:hypothetical protein
VTGNLALDLLISAAGVGLIVAVSAALGGLRSITLDEAAARARLALDEPDFRPTEIFIGADGKAAAAIGADGEAALLFALGDGLATRRLAIGAFAVAASGPAVDILLRDPSKRRLRLVAASAEAAAAWAGRLAGRPVS